MKHERDDQPARMATPGDPKMGLTATTVSDPPDESRTLTIDDIDQIREGIDHFIIANDAGVEEVWQPFLDKLAALRTDLMVLETARDILNGSICECSHLDSEHGFVDDDSTAVHDCVGNDPPGFGNCGCKEFRPATFVVTRA